MPVIDGHQITVSNPEKVMFPADGITKGDLVEYYQRIAERMLPHVRGRPLHMNRYPSGIGHIAIQQKRIPDSFPTWIKRATVDLGTPKGVDDVEGKVAGVGTRHSLVP